MAYAPRNKTYKIKWKLMFPFLVLVSLLLYAIIYAIIDHNRPVNKAFSVCGFSSEKTAELLNTKSAETIEVNDYTIYGESLGIYQDAYTMEMNDALAGKTFTMTNLCDKSEISLTMDQKIDQKLPLDELKVGIYDIRVVDKLVKKRIVFKDRRDAQILHTVKRNGVIHEISLLAKQDLLADSGIKLDKNYAYIQVKAVAKDNELDVLIDPYGMNEDITYEADPGKQANGLNESQEMFDAAQEMKAVLEKQGLRVGITKKTFDEVGKAYGEKGRLAMGYANKAKYYLFLRFNTSEIESAKGVEIYHSGYASPALAKTVMYGLGKQLGMSGSPLYSLDLDNPGVNSSILIKGVDDRNGYDNNLYLRESGGRATFAGQYSENAIEDNSSFAQASGMLGLEIDFAYISNAEDAQYWKDNKKQIAQACAKAFASGIHVIQE